MHIDAISVIMLRFKIFFRDSVSPQPGDDEYAIKIFGEKTQADAAALAHPQHGTCWAPGSDLLVHLAAHGEARTVWWVGGSMHARARV